MPPTHYSQNDTGGQPWRKTLPGLSVPAISVNCARLNKYLFHRLSPPLPLYSPKSIWILCTSHHQEDTNTSFKLDVPLHIGQNGKCFDKKQPSRWRTSSFTTSSIDGALYSKSLVITVRPSSKRGLYSPPHCPAGL